MEAWEGPRGFAEEEVGQYGLLFGAGARLEEVLATGVTVMVGLANGVLVDGLLEDAIAVGLAEDLFAAEEVFWMLDGTLVVSSR